MAANSNGLQHRVRLFGIDIDCVNTSNAIDTVLDWVRGPDGTMRYVVTPNVQHTMVFQDDAPFREAYAGASLVIADGWPLVWASRLFGDPLPERVTGSDFLPNLFERVSPERPVTLFLLGAAPGIGERAKAAIESRWPGARVLGVYSPPFGFEKDDAENRRILELIAAQNPDLLVVGLGAPKQELWTYRYRGELKTKVALCLGGTIDFLAGTKARAPKWMQSLGLEWVHRAVTEPRRLGRRYAEHAARFPALLFKEWRGVRARAR